MKQHRGRWSTRLRAGSCIVNCTGSMYYNYTVLAVELCIVIALELRSSEYFVPRSEHANHRRHR
jgi:hypothetical protein